MNDGPDLDVKVVAIAGAFEDDAIPFAFGGAIAFAYYGEPRATVDVDVNVFVEPASFALVRGALARIGVPATAADERLVLRDGRARLRWGITPIDLFFAYDAFHFHAARRIRRVPFGSDVIPILAAEDLLVCKVVFDRTKDWIDIDQMLFLTAGALDLDDVRRWLVAIVGPDDARLERFESAVRAVLGDQSA